MGKCHDTTADEMVSTDWGDAHSVVRADVLDGGLLLALDDRDKRFDAMTRQGHAPPSARPSALAAG